MNAKKRAEFVAYLKETLIPDLKDAGSEATAADFATAVDVIEQLEMRLMRIAVALGEHNRTEHNRTNPNCAMRRTDGAMACDCDETNRD